MSKRSKGFPRLSLRNAVQVMDKAMKYGRSWTKEEFASYGSKSNTKGSARSGAFANRLAALKDYGLITSTKDSVASTDLAGRLIKPINETERVAALKEAFRNPDVFREILDSVENDTELSKDHIAEIAVRKLGISRNHMNTFKKNFLESGKLAGIVKDIDAQTFSVLDRNGNSSSGSSQDASSATPTDKNKATELPGEELVEAPPLHIGNTKEASVYGAQHKGENWQVNIQFLLGVRISPELRNSIRDLVAKTDAIADKLYELDSTEGR